MFSRIFVAAIIALPVITSAAPAEAGIGDSNCNVGTINCCNQVQAIPSTIFTAITSGIFGAAGNFLPFVGTGCTPIGVLGVGGNNCNAQPACCQNTQFNSLIGGLNCSPINVNV